MNCQQAIFVSTTSKTANACNCFNGVENLYILSRKVASSENVQLFTIIAFLHALIILWKRNKPELQIKDES